MISTVAAVLAVCAAIGPAWAQWGPEVRVSEGFGDTWRKGIAASGRAVHLIWGENPIRYRGSLDEGRTWSDDIVLARSGRPVLTDPLTAQDSSVYVVFLRNMSSVEDWCCRRSIGDIYFKRSLDGGRTWQPEQRLTAAGGAFRISLAASGSRLDLVWMDFRSGRWEIFYRRSLDRGATWEPEARLASGGTGFGAERPQVASIGASVHVVWMDDRDGHPPCYTTPTCPEVYYKRSTDGGATWAADVRLTFDPAFSGRPDVAVLAPSTVLVGYDEDRDHNQGHEQYVLRSSDNGKTWAPPMRLTFAPGDSEHTALAAAGSSAHQAWFDRRRKGDSEIHYRASFDKGVTWQPEETVSAGKGATTPLLAATPDAVHMVWLDRRTGSRQVWYRRRDLGAVEDIDRSDGSP